MANWKTYQNAGLGLEFKYPSGFTLNTIPSKYWKDAYTDKYSYRFFELVDNSRGCYIGPLREVGFEGSKVDTKTVSLFYGEKVELNYFPSDNGEVNFIVGGIDLPSESYLMPLNLAPLSNGLIMSDYRNTSFGKSINGGCIGDFETILTTLKLKK